MGAVQTGWKVWYHVDGTTSIYSSKTHSWDDLPQAGVQFMFRYFQDGENKWKQCLSGYDLYSAQPLQLADVPQPYIKLGVPEVHSAVSAYIDSFRANSFDRKYIQDDSIEAYARDKTMVGWYAARLNEDGTSVELFSDSTSTFDAIPQDRFLGLMRKMESDKNTRWGELVFNHEIYVLDANMEAQAASENSKIKAGTLIDSVTLESIIAMARMDTEEF